MHGHRTASSLTLALLTATFLTPPEAARAAPGDALGGEFHVNSFTTDDQLTPVVAMDADGDFVVVWRSDGQDGSSYGIFAQRFDAAGMAQGPEFQVNSYTTEQQHDPAVAMDADGDFVVAWQSRYRDGSHYSIYAQRFDAAGVAQGPEFRVQTFTDGSHIHPAVVMDAAGDFIVAWSSGPQDGDWYGVFARRYDAAGVAQGPEFQVNTFTTGNQWSPEMAMDADGDFVVAWWSDGQDGSRGGIFAQRYDAAGVAQGPEFQVNSFTTDLQHAPAVAMNADGDFVVAWDSGGQDGSDYGIIARRYDAAGVTQSPEFQVNTFTTGSQWLPDVAMDADGDFVVAWNSIIQDGSSDGVFAQRFDAAGVAQGPEFQVNTFTSFGQRYPAVAMDDDGEFVVAWSGNGPGDFAGVFAQRFQGDGPVPNDFTVDGRADILWRNAVTGNALLWQMDGFTTEATGSIGAPGTDWQVRGLADFNADTKTDVLWRNTATGSATLWLMDGFTSLAKGGIGGAGLDWQIVDTGDFDGDDHADILWRNTSTGAALIWQMDGFTKTASGGIGTVPLVWEVAGVGDFDTDAKSDILWRNTTTGAALIWQMDGFARLAAGGIGGASLDWRVAGLADFDADAKSDILWRHTGTGSTMIWKMNGLAKDTAGGIGAPPLVWDLEGAGDSDGDRKADILWRNTGTGAALVWKMNGFVTDAVGGIGSVPLVWEVQ